jgi:hypothetical protein
MLRRLIEKLRERDREMVQEIERHFGKPADTRTNWRLVLFWSAVVVVGILLYYFASQR